MLIAFSFQAKPGLEKPFEALLNDPQAGKKIAQQMGATRNTLFLSEAGRMVRVLEFPDGAKPRPLADIARDDAQVAEFLRRLAPLVQDSFDPDEPGSLEAFNRRVMLRCAYDVNLAAVQPSRAEL